jgi:cbb3-type cytochrome oxidase subunit 1
MFTAIVALSPTDNTASRQLVLAISQTSATVSGTPFVNVEYSTANVGYPYLKVNAVIPIYTGSPTIYLVGYCLGSAATVQTINSLSHFTFTRIA